MTVHTALTIADLVAELVDPHEHREPRWTWSAGRNKVKLPDHITTHPGLLHQLHAAVRPAMSSATDQGGSHHAARSTPPLQLDALSCYLDITVAAADWCEHLDIQLRTTPADNIRALNAAANTDAADQLLNDLRRWRGWAATMTGWQELFTPRAWCPVIDCTADAPGTLRVNVTRQTAICTTCRSWWEPGTIGLLAQHIADTTTHTRTPIRSGTTGHGGWRSRATNGAPS